MKKNLNKKINLVIFFSEKLEKRLGGPSTYLFNLLHSFEKNYPAISYNNFLISNKNIQVKFIFKEGGKENNKKNNKYILETKKIIKNYKFFCYFYLLASNIRHYRTFNQYKNDIKNADIIHFHSVLDFKFLKKFVNKKTTKILTVHSPGSIIEEIPPQDCKYLFLKEIAILEKSAMEWIDGFIYPCKQSLENHLKSFSFLKNIISQKIISFCPTGIEPLEVFKSRREIRKKYNIPQDSFLVSYIGRHIKVKGFDLLANAIIKINKKIEKNKKIYLISAGKGELIYLFKKNKQLFKYWRHIEWTDCPGDIINASDCFVLPNRSCFFDLALLEAMSVGVPIIVTRVGGSIFVSKKSKGIFLTDPKIENIEEEILKLITLSREKRAEFGLINKKSFQDHFSQEKFSQKYVDAILKIFEKKKKQDNKFFNFT